MSELKKVATRAGFGEEILKLGKSMQISERAVRQETSVRNYLQSIMTIRISM